MKSRLRFFHSLRLLPWMLVFAGLIGCDQVGGIFGMETSARKTAQLEAEGKAVGGGCRQSGRAIEDCYSVYNWLPKEAIFSGWLEMDSYMRGNNLDTVPPLLPPAPPPPAPLPPPPPEPSKKKKKASAGDSAPVEPLPVPLPIITPMPTPTPTVEPAPAPDVSFNSTLPSQS